MSNLKHFSAFLAVGRRFSLDVKLHDGGSVRAALQVESSNLHDFVDCVMTGLVDFLPLFESDPRYKTDANLFRDLDRFVEYYDVEVFTNLANLVSDINKASI